MSNKKPRLGSKELQNVVNKKCLGEYPSTARIRVSVNPPVYHEVCLHALMASSEMVKNMTKYKAADKTNEVIEFDFATTPGLRRDYLPTVLAQLKPFPKVFISKNNVLDSLPWHACLISKGHDKCDSILANAISENSALIQKFPVSSKMKMLVDEVFEFGNAAMKHGCLRGSVAFEKFAITMSEKSENFDILPALSLKNWTILLHMCENQSSIAEHVLQLVNNLQLACVKMNKQMFTNDLLPTLIFLKIRDEMCMQAVDRIVRSDIPDSTKEAYMNQLKEPEGLIRWNIGGHKMHLHTRGGPHSESRNVVSLL